MNTPVNFDLAKSLRENGFDVPVKGRIHVSHWHLVKDNVIPANVNIGYGGAFSPVENWNNPGLHYMSIPTVAEAISWVYSKYSLWIYAVKTNYGWTAVVKDYSGDNYRTVYTTHSEEMFLAHAQDKWSKSYADAYQAAIKHCLHNFSKIESN